MGEKDNRQKEKDKSFSYFRRPSFAKASEGDAARLHDRKTARHIPARMAELVDALVSNTSGSNAVPVRSRLRVQYKSQPVDY